MAKEPRRFRINGFYAPNTTPIPDDVFDKLLAVLSGAELKVLLYICRRTFGFKKQKDSISLNQMVNGIKKKNGEVLDAGTGLGKASVARAAKSLEEMGAIVRIQNRSTKKGDEPTTYSLNVLPVSQNETPPGTILRHPRVSKSNPQETVLQETVYKTVNGDDSIFKKLPTIDQSQDKTEYVANHIMEELKDAHSERFYKLIAARIPEDIIRKAISEIKADGAEEPPKLFTYKMNKYTIERLKKRLIQKGG
ncbi:MAG: replication protein [Flavobacteriaceae bacterium]|nr:replication protein [Flavobacteriaceae bacterium]